MNRTAAALALALFLPWSGLAAQEDKVYPHTIHHREQVVRAVFDPEFDRQTRRNLLRWARFISSALLQVYGRWPRDEWEIWASPVAVGSDDVIPWAQVKRGDVNRVEFLVDTYASLDALKLHWTAYHELAHLLLPYRGYGGVWFSEGLATYYQNILLARSGMITEQEVWQNIIDGFDSARQDSALSQHPLQQVAANLANNGAYTRVYWTGAWYFLVVDTQLRRASDGEITLDTVLSDLNRCCGERKMSVPEIVAELDRIYPGELFSNLYLETAASTTVPPLEETLNALGISVVDGRVELERLTPAAELRRQISATREIWELQ